MNPFRRRPRAAREDASVRDSVLLHPLMAVVALLAPPVAALGGDASQFRAIVEAKLRVDLRQGGLRNPNRPGRGGLALTCLGYVLLGTLWLGMTAFVEPHAYSYMALVQLVTMVLLAVTLVTDFMSLIMDPADLSALAPCPVSDRTLLLARLVHVGLYLALVTGSLVLGPTVMGSLVHGPLPWTAAMLLVTPLAGLLVLMLVLAVFLAVIRLVGPDRVRSVMLAAQMLLSLGIFSAWQFLVMRVQDVSSLEALRTETPLKLLLPPYWFGQVAALLVDGPTPLRLAGTGLALALPLAVAAAVLRLASAQRLAAMAAMAGAEPDARAGARPGLLRRLGALLTRPGPERAGFDMFLTVARRDRMFRMRVYPMLVIPVVFVAFFAYSGGTRSEHVPLAVAAAALPAIYSFIILIQTRYSETPRAAWIFATAPVEQLGLFTSGVVRALCFCFLFPWLVVVLGMTAALTGRGRFLDSLFASLAVVTATLVLAGLLTRRTLPFSREMVPIDGASNILALVVGSSLMGLLIGVWWLLKGNAAALLAVTALLVPVCWFFAHRLRRLRVPCPTPDAD